MIKTERLLLRQWCEKDLEPFAQITSDPRTTEFFSTSTLTREESDRLARQFMRQIEERGWGYWAVAVPGVSDFIGYIGLAEVPYKAHFTPAIGIGWQLAYDHWGKGYATEGAKAVLSHAFDKLHLKEVVAITVPYNERSRNLMDRLEMHHNPDDDFDHPSFSEGDPFRRRVLYRKKSGN
jgi:3-dehydroquinate dehydratase/shikimate dehydrogenase